MAKTGTKTRPRQATMTSPISGSTIPTGAHKKNTGGKKGRSGRRPEAFKSLLARLRQSPELAISLENAIKDHECRAFPSALKVLSDYDDDKPAEKHTVVGPVVVTVRVVREGRRTDAK